MRWGMARLATLGATALAVVLPAATAHAAPNAGSLIRLGDLGPGYLVEDSGCGVGPTYEGASPRLRRFNDRHRRGYRGCSIDVAEAWRPPGAPARPEAVASVAIRFATSAGARAAFRIGPDFAAYNFGVTQRKLRRLGPGRTVGQESRIYSTRDALVGDTTGRPALVTVWRTGRNLSLIFVAGKPEAARLGEMLRLAETQQQRVVSARPLPPGANDDRFVSLDDPDLDVPIHWLGARFRAPGLPPLRFQEGQVTGPDDAGPGSAARIEYSAAGGRRRVPGVDLHIWRPAAWATYIRSRTGRLVWAARCTRATRVALPTGYATLFAGHSKRQRRCGRRPDRFLAHVHLPGVVVAVNMPVCLACAERGRDPWNSLRGMRAVVRGLALRVPR